MKLRWIAPVLLMLAACGQKPAETAPPAEAAKGQGACAAQASMDWAPEGGGSYRISARTSGPLCNSGMATIEISDGGGKVLFSTEREIEPMRSTVFAEATESAGAEAALKQWIDPAQNGDTTSSLPDWPAGAEQPVSGEFPFYPAEGMTRDAYLRLRAQDKPLYCFVQGGESQLCLVLDGGAVSEAGMQTFPG
jgi:hypothetical protein